jgi:hypothetical protein
VSRLRVSGWFERERPGVLGFHPRFPGTWIHRRIDGALALVVHFDLVNQNRRIRAAPPAPKSTGTRAAMKAYRQRLLRRWALCQGLWSVSARVWSLNPPQDLPMWTSVNRLSGFHASRPPERFRALKRARFRQWLFFIKRMTFEQEELLAPALWLYAIGAPPALLSIAPSWRFPQLTSLQCIWQIVVDMLPQ